MNTETIRRWIIYVAIVVGGVVMGQESRPWAGRTPATPGDAGSYTAQEWWNSWGPMLRSSNALTFPALNDIGVFLASDFGGVAWDAAKVYAVGSSVRPTVDNYHAYVVTAIAGTGTSGGVEPTWPTYPGTTVIDNPGANQVVWTCRPPGGMGPYSITANAVRIAPGVAIVDGNVFESTAVEEFIIPNATAGNVRDDRIVVRKTFNILTQTSRLVLLTGSEIAAPGPGTPPALTQDRTRTVYWDIPIARVSVTDAGVITVTDERVFVDAVRVERFVPAMAGYNTTDGSDIPVTWPPAVAAYSSVTLPDSKSSLMSVDFQVPENFVSGMYVKSVVITDVGVNGDIYANTVAVYAACGEGLGAHQDSSSQSAIALTAEEMSCIDLLPLTLASAGDLVFMRFVRDAVDVLDTVGDVVYGWGYIYSYIGWR